MLSSRISMKSLAQVCRSLGTMLHSGVAIQKAFDTAADKVSDLRCRRALEEIAADIREGDDVTTAMQRQGDAFPPLMIDMVSVAEQTGELPEILYGLADHYDNLLRLRRSFLSSIAWPMFQLVAAIVVIALLIFILGMIGDSRGGGPAFRMPFGLAGASGAVIWLMMTFGTLLGVIAAYQLANRSFRSKRVLDPVLMGIPVVGNCMRSFAVARFSWAFHLTQQTGMPIDQSLEASLRATNNGAFQDAAPKVCGMVNAGEPLSDALRAPRLFPEDFLQMVEVAETSGTVPEALHRLSPQFEEQARRSLAALAAALGWGIWLLVAVFIVFLIFSIFLQYIGMINEAARGL